MAPFCLRQLYAGRCDQPNCALNHKMALCHICAAICPSPAVLKKHRKGKQHRAMEAATTASFVLKCPVCMIIVRNDGDWAGHVSGSSHRAIALSKGAATTVQPLDASLPNHYRCQICKRSIRISEWNGHIQSKAHTRLQQAAVYRGRLQVERAGQERHGATVSHSEKGLDFGIVTRVNSQRGVQLQLVVRADQDAPSRVSIDRVEVSAGGNTGGKSP